MSVPNLANIVKKPSSAPASGAPSPVHQRSIDSMLQQEKSNNFQKEMQTTIQMIQEAIASHKEDTKKNHETNNNQHKLEEKMDRINEVFNINSQLEKYQQMIAKNEQRIQKMLDKSEETEKKMEEIKENQRLAQANKNVDDTSNVGDEESFIFIKIPEYT
uniref:Uncharacterized protein n=1 Tax=Micrurus spixii TaxID=129469 RepID=A0A2D4LYK4_9SAUR